MIEKIAFENFRGFERMELSDIKPITLISGKNNAGKSSVLEGVFLFFDHTAPESFLKISNLRGVTPALDIRSLWEPLFYQLDTQKKLRISMTAEGQDVLLEYAKDDSFIPPKEATMSPEMMNQIISSAKTSYTLKVRFQRGDYVEDGHFIMTPMGVVRNMTTSHENQIESLRYIQFIDAAVINTNAVFVAESLGRVELKGEKQSVIDVLKLIDPDITDLFPVVMNGQAQLYVKIGNRPLPLRLAGDGLNKLLCIVLAITANPDSIILIDEIETGFHYSMLPVLWETVARAAQKNRCQVIATTHSYECIAGASEGIQRAGCISDFCYYRIDKGGEGSSVSRYSDELLQIAVSTDMEVR